MSYLAENTRARAGCFGAANLLMRESAYQYRGSRVMTVVCDEAMPHLLTWRQWRTADYHADLRAGNNPHLPHRSPHE